MDPAHEHADYPPLRSVYAVCASNTCKIVNWLPMARGRVKLCALVNTVMNRRLP